MATFKPWSLIVLFAFVFRTTGRPSTTSPPPVPRARQALQNSTALSSPSLPRSGLNAAARSAGKLYFGTATNNYELDDTAYVAILDDSAMFGQLTPAKAMKWNHTEPERGVFTWEEGDQIVALARQGGKLMRGHNCVWYNEIPDWVTNTTWTAPELAEIVQEHCFNIVRHWAGQIWDVINEPFNDDGTWRETIWYNTLNTSYIPLALHAARRADPHAKLYINEYNTTGPGPKASALKAHESVGEVPPLADVKRNLAEFAALGVEVAITELDVRFATLPPEPDAAGLAQQRRDFETIVRACREVEGCVGLTVWDWTDKYSWVPASFPGEGDACPFDADLEPKPAYYGIVDGLRR
ncbi:endo-beta-1,4-glucanase [Ganoderma leucocontextum]|nr:endo-beta-1,4-glucanase [Ganoderma leucocontextum]